MNKKFGWTLGIVAIAVVALGAFGTSIAHADDGGPGHRTGRFNGEALNVVADMLGMTPEEVTTAIQEDGMTMQELADAAGVDMQEIKDAVREVRGKNPRERSLDGEALDVVAAALDMTPEEVTAAMQDDGATLQELADKAGVDMQEIKDALSDLRTENMRERIGTALDAGNLTQGEANWLLEGVDNGYLGKLGKWFMKRGGKR